MTMAIKLLCCLAAFVFAAVSSQSTSGTEEPSYPSGTYVPASGAEVATDVGTGIYIGSPGSSEVSSDTEGYGWPSTPLTPATSTYYSGESSSSEASENADDYEDYDEDGQADNLADYVMKKVGQLLANAGLTGQEEEEEGELGTGAADSAQANETVVEEDNADLKNCSALPTLDRFCTVPDQVQDFFDYDLSVEGILSSLFRPDMLEALAANCPAGSWCLADDYHQDIFSEMENFYELSPVCSDAMWFCLQTMMDKRYDCSDKNLNFLVNTVLLLCDLHSVGDLGPECYARTKEALYVTYVDLNHPNGSHMEDMKKDDCNDFKVQMTKSYLCADDVCGFDQNLILSKFESWVGLANRAAGIAVTCNITDQCQTDYNDDDDDDYEGDYYYYYDGAETTTQNYEDYKEELAEIEEEIQKELEESENEQEQGTGTGDSNDEPLNDNQSGFDDDLFADTNSAYGAEDRTMLYGLIAMTTILTLGLLSIAVMGYRRYRWYKSASYKRGYSQLTDEEAKMLRNEYN